MVLPIDHPVLPGLPTFIRQPEDVSVRANTSFVLSCEAVGPPGPITIRWLRDGTPDGDFRPSPSNHTVPGETPTCTRSQTLSQCVPRWARGYWETFGEIHLMVCFSHSHSHTLSLSHSFSLSHTISLSHSFSLSHSLFLSLSNTHTKILSLILSNILSLSHVKIRFILTN